MTKRKIAILGGGIGSLTTAYYLTRTPELRARYDVTLYQLGWRLGGKCASGRSLAPDEGHRSEEHGLHLWFGLYENAFKTIQEIYERKPKNADDPLKTWRDAFKPNSFTPLGEDYQGELGYWPFVWPDQPGFPGDGVPLDEPRIIVRKLAMFVAGILRDLTVSGTSKPTTLRDFLDNVGDALQAGVVTTLLTGLEALAKLDDFVFGGHGTPFDELRPLIEEVRHLLQKRAHKHFDDVEFRRFYSIADLGLTIMFGLSDPTSGFLRDFDLDRFDDEELRAWLLRYGGDPWVVNESSYLRALYDLPFAYEDGDIEKPSFAAGTAIRVILRIILTYKEACFFDMQAGMGEAVIAPFYRVLEQQGVKVEFFRKVKKLELSPDKRWVQRVWMDRQVELAPETNGTYTPTFPLNGLECWPSEPHWAQIKDGAALKARLAAKKMTLESHWCLESVGQEELVLGRDFDQVVLGIALGAWKKLNDEATLADEVVAHSDAMRLTAEKLGLVPTQAFQIWTKPDLAGLGFEAAALGRPAMDGAPEPYSVWADASQVLPTETWPANGPKGVFYFCGPWKTDLVAKPSTDASVPERAHADVRAEAEACLSSYVGYMWKNARDPANPKGLDWAKLYDPRGGSGAARLDFQWIRPNVDPTECCETSLPGTTRYRLKADESGYENLFLAGAWLRTGLNATCVEAATMSGMDCARAISEEPLPIYGEWFLTKKPARFR